MGRQIVRKRRVFSIDPNKFATKYAKYLMKSLVKISSNNLSPQKFQKLVKFEVDMAMAESATQFAWGNALKKKLLQTKVANGFDFSLQTLKFSRENLEREEEEEEKMENGLKRLRKIIPGGGGGGGFNGGLEEEELLKQTESYIKCLELQVNVLRCLVETNTI
ncbi:transcription factor bHLH146-like [Cucurbita moschata]|uniref:Transcription factor bHLH146-like n=1 Tax=Cucurbita moschata TaxID=3662 RepID=A0A6J1EPJ9_CUCMO|nr:transcription factor bHLH146-like [Cucurbita moschata]